MGKRDGDFTEATKRIIAQRVNGFCSFESCRRITFVAHSDPSRAVNLGEAAHIAAASPAGPRYDPSMSEVERKSASNGIWMCREHAREIDADPASFPVETLQRWKREREEQVARSREFFLRAGSPHWNVPARNDYFTGRDDVLVVLGDRLLRDRGVAITQAIVGLGGIGKTQLAIEFCHRHRKRYPFGIFWADAASNHSLRESFASFAMKLGWVDPKASQEDGVESWLHHIRDHSGWLLVLDNADEPDDLDGLIPTSADGHVVVTTRQSDPDIGLDPLAIEVWSSEDAVSFLSERTGRSDEDLKGLAEELGCLPLALEQAGAYLRRQKGVTVAAYLAGLGRRKVEFLESRKGVRPLKGNYEQTVATTWGVSFDRLPPAAREVMQALAFLAPDGIPHGFLEFCGGLGPALSVLDLSDEIVVSEEILEPLCRYSLIRFAVGTQGTLQIHRLVQTVTIYSVGSETCQFAIFEKVFRVLDACFPVDPELPASWETGRLWMPHVLQSLEQWESFQGDGSWDPTPLWFRAGRLAWASGSPAIARRLYEKTLEVRHDLLGPDHPSTLDAMGNLAGSLWEVGDFEAARELQERGLEIRRRVLGLEHPDTLRTAGNLAGSLQSLGDLQAAMELLEDNLEIQTRRLGEEHLSTLRTKANLGRVLWPLGDVHRSRRILEEVLEARRRILGPEHPDTIKLIRLIGIALKDGQRTLPILEEALSLSTQVFGSEHPETLQAALSCAFQLQLLDRLPEAKCLFESSLEASSRVRGEHHPETQKLALGLASSFLLLGSAQEAHDLLKDRLVISRQRLKTKDPITLGMISVLGVSLWRLGDSVRARPLLEENYKTHREIDGPDHISTLRSQANLCLCHRSLGDIEEAARLEEEVFALCGSAFGPDSPETLELIHDFLSALDDKDDLEVDENLKTELLARVRLLPESDRLRNRIEERWNGR